MDAPITVTYRYIEPEDDSAYVTTIARELGDVEYLRAISAGVNFLGAEFCNGAYRFRDPFTDSVQSIENEDLAALGTAYRDNRGMLAYHFWLTTR